MRVDNATFAGFNTAPEKSPRFVIVQSFDDANTDLLALTSHPDTATPPGVPVISDVVRQISGQSQKIAPDKGNATIGGFNFSIVDKDKQLNTYIRDKLDFGRGMRHKQTVCYVGFEGMEWAEYQPVLTYIIDGITYKNGDYKFKCSDIQRKVRQKIFAPEEKFLSKSVTATQMHIPVLTSNLALFPGVAHDSSYTDRPNQTVGYIRLEDEIICHDGVLFVDPTDGVSFQVVPNGRGALNTVAAEHVHDSGKASDRQPKITEHIFIEGPAPKVAYALLTGNLEGQPGETYPDNWHLGISPSNVRLSDFTGIGSDVWDTATDNGRHVRIEGPKSQDGKAFIEKEIMYWLGAFMPVYSTGELGLKRLNPVLSNSGYVAHLTDQNIRSYSDLSHDMKSVINLWDVEWNYVFQKDEFTKRTPLIDADSIAKHKIADKKDIKLRAIHTGAHVDEDIRSYFDTMRDRYSGPPLRLSIEVLPSLNWLEVGDTVRVTLPQIRDFTNGETVELDRVFEIQQVQMNWRTGKLKLDLFGSSQKAGTLEKTTLAAVLDDAFYSSQGIELSTVLNIVAGSVTQDGTLTGAPLMKDAIYYYLGDLTIDPGVIVTITQNVELRIRGHLTINGKIDGKGQGHPGGAGATLWASNSSKSITLPLGQVPIHDAVVGVKGELGITKPSGDNGRKFPGSYSDHPVVSGSSSIGFYNISNNNTAISGDPENLIGTSGSGGGVITRITGSSGRLTHAIQISGTDGGNSGAGLKIISRGLSFGGGGGIDLSGDDAPENNEPEWTYNGTTWRGSPGAGGAPGGFALFLDGNHTPPELGIYLTSLHGNSPYKGNRNDPSNRQPPYSYALEVGFPGYDMKQSAYTLQYIPESATPQEETNSIPPDVTGFTSEISGENALLKWDGILSTKLSHFELRAGTIWETANPIAEVRLNYFNVQLFTAGTYNYLIKAVFNDADNSKSETATLTTLNATAFVPSESGATAGATWGADILLQPTDAQLLNNQQTWAEVGGAAKPADNADVTNTALEAGETITQGGITLSAGGALRSTDLLDESVDLLAGVWLGYNGTDYTFGVGDGQERYLKYTGSSFSIGSGVELNGANSIRNKSMHNYFDFQAIDSYTTAGTVTIIPEGLKIVGSAGVGVGYCYRMVRGAYPYTWSKDRHFKVKLKPVSANGNLANGELIYILFGPLNFSSFGFMLSWNTTTALFDVYLYGDDGTSAPTTSLITTLSDNTEILLEADLVASTSIDGKVTIGGVTTNATQLTTGIPSASDDFNSHFVNYASLVATTSKTTVAYLEISDWTTIQDA